MTAQQRFMDFDMPLKTPEGSREAAAMEPELLMRLLADATCRDSTLVIDTRPFLAYNTSHIRTALNAYYPPILLRRRAGGRETCPPLEAIVRDAGVCRELRDGRYKNVVVYDEGIGRGSSGRSGSERVTSSLESCGPERLESHLDLVLGSFGSGLADVAAVDVRFLDGGYF